MCILRPNPNRISALCCVTHIKNIHKIYCNFIRICIGEDTSSDVIERRQPDTQKDICIFRLCLVCTFNSTCSILSSISFYPAKSQHWPNALLEKSEAQFMRKYCRFILAEATARIILWFNRRTVLTVPRKEALEYRATVIRGRAIDERQLCQSVYQWQEYFLLFEFNPKYEAARAVLMQHYYYCRMCVPQFYATTYGKCILDAVRWAAQQDGFSGGYHECTLGSCIYDAVRLGIICFNLDKLDWGFGVATSE